MYHLDLKSVYNLITIKLPHQIGINNTEHSLLFVTFVAFSFWHLLNLRYFSVGGCSFSVIRRHKEFLLTLIALILCVFLIVFLNLNTFMLGKIRLLDGVFLFLSTSFIFGINKLIVIFFHKDINIRHFCSNQINKCPQRLMCLKTIVIKLFKKFVAMLKRGLFIVYNFFKLIFKFLNR